MAKWHVMGRAIHMPLTSFMPLASFINKLLIRLHAFQQFKTVKCHKAFTLNLAYRIRQDLWTINNTPPPKKNKTHSKIATCREVLNPQIQKMIFFAQPPHQKVCLIGLKLNIIPKHKKVSKNQHNINHFNKNILKNWPTKRTKKTITQEHFSSYKIISKNTRTCSRVERWAVILEKTIHRNTTLHPLAILPIYSFSRFLWSALRETLLTVELQQSDWPSQAELGQALAQITT